MIELCKGSHNQNKNKSSVQTKWNKTRTVNSTSFPGSLLFTPQEAREGRPWLGLVTCLPKSGRLQISDWREGRLSVSLPSLASWGVKRRDTGNEVAVNSMRKIQNKAAKRVASYADALWACHEFLPHVEEEFVTIPKSVCVGGYKKRCPFNTGTFHSKCGGEKVGLVLLSA